MMKQVLLSDEEIEQVWPDFPTEAIDRECPLSQGELEIIARQVAIAAKVVAKAQLKKVVEWKTEPCSHDEAYEKYECDACWQALLEEVK